ncbi:MAG: DUF3810 domain-containing protein [Bacteroidota bacterium]
MRQQKNIKRLDRRLIWIGLGLVAFLLKWIFSLNPQFTEIVYSRVIFVAFRTIWDYTLGWMPLPLVYLLFIALIWFTVRHIRKGLIRWKARNWRQRIGNALLNSLAIASAISFFFLILWGYNYQRQPVEYHLEITADSLSQPELTSEFERATADLLMAYSRLQIVDSVAISATQLPEEMEVELREKLTEVLQENGYPTPGRVRGRQLWPRGLLMNLGASGIYIPFVAEGHIDAGLAPVVHPSVMTHEMAHGYGFGDEGSCNFWAWLACSRSANPVVRYSGALEYWREVATEYYYPRRDEYRAFRKTLPKGIQADLDAISAVRKKYPGFFPRFSQSVYNQYLQSQGIEEGTANYNRVINLVAGWRQKNP